MLRSYKNLIVWQKAMELVQEIYRVTALFPKTEMYGIVSQMRRAAISIPSNIAEGHGRSGKKMYHHFLGIAYSSGAELETQIEISKNLGFMESKHSEKTDSLLLEVMKMLNKMLSNLSAP